MSEPRPKSNEWITPQNLLALAGMFGMAYTSYQTFQRDTSQRVTTLELRVGALEKTASDLTEADRSIGKENVERDLRLDRLERAK